MYDKLKDLDMEMMVLDAGYKTPAIARELLKDGIQPLFPYKRPMTKMDSSGNMSMSTMSTMTAISVRRIRSLLIGQRTGRVTKNTRAIKASVKTVLTFPNVQKAKSMKKRSPATFGKSIWKPVRISAILSGTKRFIC